jgi:hypothetical protein
MLQFNPLECNMATPSSLETIYTADEAAARLRLSSRRGVIKLGRKYGLCARFGRDYLFSEADLLNLWEVLREPAQSHKPPPLKPRISDIRLHESLLKLSAKKKAGPVRKRWEATNAKNKELRETTKVEIEKWKDEEPLDHTNHDPEYWTADRKDRRRLESLAKKKGWMVRT